MDAALGWIGEIIEWLGQWVPRWLVITPQDRAIKFVRGKKTRVLEPGVRWYWPPFTEVDGPFPVTWQPMATSTLHLMDKDNTPVSAQGFIVFRVVDPVKYRVDHHAAEDCIDDVVGAAIRDVITSKSVKEVQGNHRRTTDTALTRTAAQALEDFGVEVRHVRLTTFTTTKMVSMLGEHATSMLPEEDEE